MVDFVFSFICFIFCYSRLQFEKSYYGFIGLSRQKENEKDQFKTNAKQLYTHTHTHVP